MTDPNPSGMCLCGCGGRAPIAQKNNTARGYVRGRPFRFIAGHQARTEEARVRAAAVMATIRKPRPVKHGHSKRSPTYQSWVAMKNRCLNCNQKSYKNYGGRGITICDRWLNSFENFLADMGQRPEGTSLDRIDVNGNYEPGNCRWATAREQRLNQRERVLSAVGGA